MKISIIVPMYNSEKYIGRCLNSLINQTYYNIEIIVIDDGSTDTSYSKVKAFDDQRIRLYSKKNGGVSSARNLGLQSATGDLIMFVDADDYVDLKMVEMLVNEVDDLDSSFLVCNNYELYDNRIDKRVIVDNNRQSQSITKVDMIELIATGRAGLVCSKLVSRKVITDHQIIFDEKIKVGEDQLFFLQVAQYCSNFKYINECLYYYDRRNETSATISYQKDLSSNFIYLHQKVKEILNQTLIDKVVIQTLLDDKVFSMFLHCLQNEIRNVSILNLRTFYLNVKENMIRFSTLINLDSYRPKNKLSKEIYKSFININIIQVIKIIALGYLLKLRG